MRTNIDPTCSRFDHRPEWSRRPRNVLLLGRQELRWPGVQTWLYGGPAGITISTIAWATPIGIDGDYRPTIRRLRRQIAIELPAIMILESQAAQARTSERRDRPG
jgi:hypothetical protein